MERFASTRALITGGSRGIGAAVARRLAAEGAAVTITYRSNAGLADALVAELTEAATPRSRSAATCATGPRRMR